jgi:hypothetical protein
MARQSAAFPITPFKTPTPFTLPMDSPTKLTRRRYDGSGLIGILTIGTLASVVQFPKTSPGGNNRPNFPVLEPSGAEAAGGVVAPSVQGSNFMRTAFVVALNLFSPQHHSTPANVQGIQTQAEVSNKTQGPHSYTMPKKTNLRGTGGWYTLPAPPNVPTWPAFVDRLAGYR